MTSSCDSLKSNLTAAYHNHIVPNIHNRCRKSPVPSAVSTNHVHLNRSWSIWSWPILTRTDFPLHPLIHPVRPQSPLTAIIRSVASSGEERWGQCNGVMFGWRSIIVWTNYTQFIPVIYNRRRMQFRPITHWTNSKIEQTVSQINKYRMSLWCAMSYAVSAVSAMQAEARGLLWKGMCICESVCNLFVCNVFIGLLPYSEC